MFLIIYPPVINGWEIVHLSIIISVASFIFKILYGNYTRLPVPAIVWDFCSGFRLVCLCPSDQVCFQEDSLHVKFEELDGGRCTR